MIPIYSEREIKIMREGGEKLTKVLNAALRAAKPGKTLRQIDEVAEEKIGELGGKPSFKMVPGYHWASCLNLNEGVVHGIPDDTPISKGDLLSIDIGFYSQGFHTDMAETIEVGSPRELASRGRGKGGVRSDKFLETGKKALEKVMEQVKPGNRVGHLSRTIEETIKKAGYQPVQALTGHGVGRQLHQDPAIPCFLDRKIEATPALKKGMVLAIEVIYTQGSPEIFTASDGWTIRTQDGKIAGLFEKTVAVGANGSLVLTR
jgi:methionyl aminopeptidase